MHVSAEGGYASNSKKKGSGNFKPPEIKLAQFDDSPVPNLKPMGKSSRNTEQFDSGSQRDMGGCKAVKEERSSTK